MSNMTHSWISWYFPSKNETTTQGFLLRGVGNIFIYQFLFLISEMVPDVLISLRFGVVDA